MDLEQAPADRLTRLMFRDVVIDCCRLQLLHPEAQAPPLAIQFENHRAYDLSFGQLVLWMLDALLASDV